jgi:two-component system, response regulator RegA
MNEVLRHNGPVRFERVVIADPEETAGGALCRQFRDAGFKEVWVAGSAHEALNVVADVLPELVVSELRFADHSGLDLLSEIRLVSRDIRLAVVTAFGSIAAAVRALRIGASACLAKPATAVEIVRAVQADGLGGNLEGREAKAEVMRIIRQRGVEGLDVRVELRHMSLDRLIWEYLSRVSLEAGSLAAAARRLGVDRRSLRRMLARQAPLEATR